MRRRATFFAALLAVSCAACGAATSSPSPVATPMSAATSTPSPSPSPTPTPTPSPSPSPTGYAAVLTALDAPGVLLAAAPSSLSFTPSFFAEMWNLRALAMSIDGFGLELGALPKARADSAGNPTIRVTIGDGATVDVVMVENSDGSLRSVAVVTPSGGYGGTVRYLLTSTFAMGLLAETLRPGESIDPIAGLDASDLTTSRVGLDSSFEASGLLFHFIGTPDDGEWLIVTSSP